MTAGEIDLERRSEIWWTAIWRDGDLDAVLDLFTDPFRRHAASGSETLSPTHYRDRLASIQRVICGAVTTIDDRVVRGDRVWTRATTRGLNKETGDRSVLTWMLIQRFEGDRIAEQWSATLPDVEWRSEG